MKKVLIFAAGFIVGGWTRRAIDQYLLKRSIKRKVEDFNRQFEEGNDFSYILGQALNGKEIDYE